ncbi:DUF559 domain-containing protein [soil metagenome]
MRRKLTPGELRLWLRLRDRSLGGFRFRKQAPLGAFIVDFFCPEVRLVVEVDGDHHGFDLYAKRDAARSAWIESQGQCVLRVSNLEVTENLEGVCSAILDLCEQRAPRPLPKTATRF